MNKTIIGTAKLKYDSDGDLQIGIFNPRIDVTKEQVKTELGKCTNKTIEEVKQCAELLLGSFFNKISEIELRDVEKTTIATDVISSQSYENGLIKEVEIQFVYIS